MQIPELNEPDDVYQWLLGTMFGETSVIVLLFLLFKSVMAWYELAQSAIKLGTTAKTFAGRAMTRIARMPAGRSTVGIVLTATMVISQALWLYSTYVTGNVLSMDVGYHPASNTNLSTLTAASFADLLRWDWLVVAYILGCVAALIHAYRISRRKKPTYGIATVLAVPIIPHALFGTIGGLLILCDYLGFISIFGSVFTRGHITFTFVVGATSVTYLLACRAVLQFPQLVVRFWRQNPASRIASGS